MRLVHRTNYWGEWISSSDMDDDVPFDAIWVQAMLDGCACCCHGFGRRGVAVRDEDLVDEFNGWWSLFKVSGEWGRTPGHFFHKYVLIPQGTHGFGKRGCAQRGWTYAGEIQAGRACERLDELLEYTIDDQTDDFNHVHIGIMMDSLYAGKGNSG